MTKSPSNDYIKSMFTDLYNKWYLPYSKASRITEAVLDEAYDKGVKVVEKYPEELAMNIFVGLFRVLEWRRTDGQDVSV